MPGSATISSPFHWFPLRKWLSSANTYFVESLSPAALSFQSILARESRVEGNPSLHCKEMGCEKFVFLLHFTLRIKDSWLSSIFRLTESAKATIYFFSATSPYWIWSCLDILLQNLIRYLNSLCSYLRSFLTHGHISWNVGVNIAMSPKQT